MLQFFSETVGDQWHNLLRVYKLSYSRRQKMNDSCDSTPTKSVTTTQRWICHRVRAKSNVEREMH